jgi:hypothetical protein
MPGEQRYLFPFLYLVISDIRTPFMDEYRADTPC